MVSLKWIMKEKPSYQNLGTSCTIMHSERSDHKNVMLQAFRNVWGFTPTISAFGILKPMGSLRKTKRPGDIYSVVDET